MDRLAGLQRSMVTTAAWIAEKIRSELRTTAMRPTTGTRNAVFRGRQTRDFNQRQVQSRGRARVPSVRWRASPCGGHRRVVTRKSTFGLAQTAPAQGGGGLRTRPSPPSTRGTTQRGGSTRDRPATAWSTARNSSLRTAPTGRRIAEQAALVGKAGRWGRKTSADWTHTVL